GGAGEWRVRLEVIAGGGLGDEEAVGRVDQSPRDVIEDLGLARALAGLAHRTTGGTSLSGMPALISRSRAVLVGLAPREDQCLARSMSMTSSTGSLRGS